MSRDANKDESPGYTHVVVVTSTYFKNFNAGDTIHFKDKLAAIHHDPAKNVTYLTFKSEKWEDVSWPFKGDLTE